MSNNDYLEEEIRLAKRHLERALARARNRDSLQEDARRWINPHPARWWKSLEQVPAGQGVVVKDKDGDHWKVKADGRLRIRFQDEKKWEKANMAGYKLSYWDHFGPFTEV